MKLIQTIFFALTLSFVSHSLIAQDHNKSVSVSLDVEKVNGEEQRNFVITIDENGTTKEIKWSDEGTLPEEIKNQLIAEGVDLKMIEGGDENEISITIDDTDGNSIEKEHEIEIMVINEGEQEETYEIEIDGEDLVLPEGKSYKVIRLSEGEALPEDIQELLEEHDIDIDIESMGGDDSESMERMIVIDVDEEIEGLHEAHDEDIDIERHKKVIIKTIDDIGSEKTIEWNGDGDMPVEIKEKLEKEGISLDVEKFLFIQDEDGKEHKAMFKEARQYKIKTIDDEGNEKVIEWNGQGEMPKEIKEHKEKAKHKRVRIKDKKGSNGNRAQLGVMIENGDHGVKVIDVIKGSAAEAAGIEEGYVITKAAGKDVKKIEDLLDAIKPYSPGENVLLDVMYHDTYKADLEVTLKGAEDKQNYFIFKDVKNAKTEDFKILKELEDCDIIVSKGSKKIKVKVIQKEEKEEEQLDVDKIKSDITPERKLNFDSFNAFPNPTNGLVNIKFEGNGVPTEVRITDISGKEVFQERLENFSGSYNKDIDLSNQVRGQFILSIIQDQKIFTQNIVLQ